MPRAKLTEIIENFRVEDFTRFFRLKTQAQGNFRPNEEKLINYNDTDFSGVIKLGQIEFSETEKLIIVVAKVVKELSERSGKKAQYEKAKKILKELQIFTAGIFIFYDDTGNFRFSLIYPESVGARRQWSNFRRFTYFVSREFTNKTFLQRVGDGDFSTLAKIKDAFSVEKVTKEFYLEYRKLFENLLGELSKNHTFLNEASKNRLDTENFAKKLLGQIVFLYFVQKKGWLGVSEGGKWGEGDKNFLSNLFRKAKSDNKNFFNDYLEKLFYNALNNPRRDSADPSFSKDFNCRIPFLNGGLFEAEYGWKDSLIYLDDKIFKAIFDVFDRYNFTVEEKSPDDKEIAVDPEMLGKVFENLLPENLRKGKGTYYTPREIVYYMCQESLINYLDSNSKIGRKKAEEYVKFMREDENKSIVAFEGEAVELDELLKNIKVCDPACGSGAFLVGMLNEIVRLRLLLRILHPEKIAKKSEYELKKETIQNCIYGVDIDPGAIEIAKLRLWLQLVVDYELRDIEPLPNLDYRLMCGNSLLEEFEGVKFYNGENIEQQATLLVDTDKQEKITELKEKVKEYFNIHDDKEKQQKRKEINDIRDWLIRSALEKRKQDLVAQRKNEEAKANMLDKKSREKYLTFWSKNFLGSESNIKKVLDTLHNPKEAKPFFIWKLEFIDVFEDKKGFDVVIANPPYVFTRGSDFSKEFKKVIKFNYETGIGKLNLFSLFIERGLKLLKADGDLIFIVPNTLFRATPYKPLREFIVNNHTIKQIVDLQEGVFEGVTASTTIIEISKNENINKGVDIIDSVEALRNKKISRVISQNDFRNKEYVFSIFLEKNTNTLFGKLLLNSEKLGLLCKDIINGIVTPKGKNKFITHKKLNEKYKPFLEGKDIDSYVIRKNNKFILFDRKKLHRPRPEYVWDAKEKLIIRRIGGGDKALFVAYDNSKYHAFASTNLILLKEGIWANIKYILSLLNSRLLNYYYVEKFTNRSSLTVNVSKVYLELLPIKKITAREQEIFIKIVDKILAITKSNDYLENPEKQAKVKEYERQIDQMVYKIYNLTKEEIEAVENFNKK